MANVPIGVYVHHDGSGHMMRALAIVRSITSPVILLSSLRPYEALPSHVTFVHLPDDTIEDYRQQPHSLFLYTPYDAKVLDRYALLLDAIRTHNIQAMYVDVSPEVAVFCKLLGLRVGLAVMHGDRTDAAHTLAYDAVDILLCHNSEQFDTPSNYKTSTPIRYSGGISRLPKYSSAQSSAIRSILVTTSRASTTISMENIIALAREFPDIQWDVIGAISEEEILTNVSVHGIVDDVRPYYETADLVIGSGGNNTIMEVASQRKPFVCIPDDKPFNEQTKAALSLQRLHAAFYEPRWPSSSRLREIIKSYDSLNLDTFHDLVDDDAPSRAARIIESLK